MEFKSRKIDVSSEEPYKNDKLNRKPAVENLSLLLRNIKSPIVLSVNAPWGSGKTTFIEMLRADLAMKDCKTIYFSAWETDFVNDPLLAFLGEMNQSLEELIDGDEKKSEAWDKAKKAGSHILRKGIPALIKIGTAGVIDTEKMLEHETSEFMQGLSKDLIDEYSKNKESIETFKENVSKVLKNTEGGIDKLYIFVDELDRCRPTYSIELLERIKHLLDIEGLVFILALDKQQLAHSVKAVYGADFDALGYLRRFIDLEYELQRSDLYEFIEQQFKIFGFNLVFKERSGFRSLQNEDVDLRKICLFLAESKQFCLREVEQFFVKINIVILLSGDNEPLYPELLIFLLITKEYHGDIYQDYIQEKNTPEAMIKLLYAIVTPDQLYSSTECALIEGYLISAKIQDSGHHIGSSLEKHETIIASEDSSNEMKRYSKRVYYTVKKYRDDWLCLRFQSLVDRIEMIGQFNL